MNARKVARKDRWKLACWSVVLLGAAGGLAYSLYETRAADAAIGGIWYGAAAELFARFGASAATVWQNFRPVLTDGSWPERARWLWPVAALALLALLWRLLYKRDGRRQSRGLDQTKPVRQAPDRDAARAAMQSPPAVQAGIAEVEAGLRRSREDIRRITAQTEQLCESAEQIRVAAFNAAIHAARAGTDAHAAHAMLQQTQIAVRQAQTVSEMLRELQGAAEPLTAALAEVAAEAASAAPRH